MDSNNKNGSSPQQQQQHLSLAFCGNSMLYYNDTPRLVEQMLKAAGYSVSQDSCLRGGASLLSLWEEGNGMQEKFATDNARLNGVSTRQEDTTNGYKDDEEPVYDIGASTVKDLFAKQLGNTTSCRRIVILHDYTQSPAREETRQAAHKVLKEKYFPAMLEQLPSGGDGTKLELLFVQTPAYRFPKMKDTQDLGDFHSFSNRIAAGYESYRQLALETAASWKTTAGVSMNSQVAPNGEAYRYLYEHDKDGLFGQLYFVEDNFHPSPHGTWLQACVLFVCITQQAPPLYNSQWWNVARRMQPPSTPIMMALPTPQEAQQLANVACRVCGLTNRGQQE